jgi:ribosome assembly protein YihI (activator of Der GTPase)
MSRQKKSRKAAPLGPTQKPRQKKDPKAETTGKRGKKTKGHSAGARNNPEIIDERKNGPAKSNDPRHGSKTPISLTPVEPIKIPDFKPQARQEKVQPVQVPPEEELEMIENDERLQALIEKVDNDELLTGKDAKYFNAKTARHQALMEELGFDVEDDEDYDEEEEGDNQSNDSRSLIEQWEDDDSDEDKRS